MGWLPSWFCGAGSAIQFTDRSTSDYVHRAFGFSWDFGLYITETAIGATVLVGAVLLEIVVNAAILVELANQIREELGCDRSSAIIKAARNACAQLKTTVTTILGIFPLALGIGEGSEFLQPLGIVVFYGMAIITLLTLFIIPCFYVMLHNLFHWNRGQQLKLRIPKILGKALAKLFW